MITGSIVALATPMHSDGSLDWDRLDQLVDFHIENGTDSIVAVGTTGESATLSPEEHCKVIERVVKRTAGRIPIIAGTGANSTLEAIELSKAAKQVGADACLSVTPYYNKPTQEGLYQHFKAIAEAVDIPQILYNVPGRTAVDMANETVVRLSSVENIIGIKDATGDVARGIELIKSVPEGFAVYSGDDPTAYELILNGGQGNISVTANIAPKKMHELCVAAANGEAEQVKAMNDSLMSLHDVMFVESNPIPVKYALHLMGLAETGIRLPLTVLDESKQPELKAELDSAGLL
ncbi:4-hydroxy-tetrahydrodipicolinate synthase [Oleiphilus sp. HI0009]|uniref:4-hydroxy-tetrahydrodipicolinate synthase n=1 Tax=unclassified Oleiphilus TaxID=2631174 RepID=UPI0007C24A5B|nr:MULTISPECIES: 4-hydroxy-tetrahydrodipicolinate synthase [unclassified Oleiphilus]KZX82154.1 4-hydroxy-tetrahydrodipicolinate synthase [Oleiphilus sp. HI0009]MCH2157889.1 4-hydroxy-tetrahydrodipicolinate synthase [Oleiphilaceae bacterium]KZY71257.1 4-hydroxy-tetrahydrodipicolinate synthase [Oleiphilus sp. HI0067]KZY72278.1 4-hydroxy-tetrahydrodipicolinate synthase [Oleiphilus sp. HI0066]KZZ58769.1 4-hydroxy-tetrahydrodipicolinate synthase [Oleiphilus sp. HI0125]